MKRQEKITSLGKINYSVRKGNPLIVFLNGFGSFDNEQSFARVITKLPKSFGILAPDYLNSGFSGRSTKPYTIFQEADEIATLINSQQAQRVILVAHSIGGVYAYYLQHQVVNLAAIIGIEPTTREVILNPPAEYAAYAQGKDSVEFIHAQINKFFGQKNADNFWQTTEKNSEKFDQKALKNASDALEKDEFWQGQGKLGNNVPVAVITEAYRQKEYERSEYFNSHPHSKIVTFGSFHYIQWEYPEKIADLIKEYAKSSEI